MRINEVYLIGDCPELAIHDSVRTFQLNTLNDFYEFLKYRFASHCLGILMINSAQDLELLDSNSNIPMLALIAEDDHQLITKCMEHNFVDVLCLRTLNLTKAKLGHYLNGALPHGKSMLYDIDSNEFTKKEFQILEVLVASKGFEISRNELQTKIWGNNLNTNTLDVHLCNLRKKLALTPLELRTVSNGRISLSKKLHIHKEVRA
jgi:hypothetical protein